MMLFILSNGVMRIFKAEHWSDIGGAGDWIDIGEWYKLEKLTRRLIPKVGTEDFFEPFLAFVSWSDSSIGELL